MWIEETQRIMSLLGLPGKLLRRERDNRSNLLDAPGENIVAEGRIILATLSLVAACVSPDLFRPHYLLSVQVLIAYAVVAVAIMATRVWRFPGRGVGYATHAMDVAVLCALGLLTEARSTPLFAFFGFCVLLGASQRWDWHGVMGTALVLALVTWVNTVHYAGPGGGVAARDVAFIRGILILAAGAMLAVSSAVRERRRLQLTRLTEWPGPDAAQMDSPNLANMLAHCARVVEAPRALVLWEEAEEPFVNVVMWDRGTYKHTREMSGFYGEFVRSQQHADLAFWTDDAASRFGSTVDGPISVRKPIIDSRLIETFAIHSVATAPFVGTLCSGRVFFLDRVSWTGFQLHLIQIIASRLANAIDREFMQGEAKQAAADRERARLTRDLHDGLLQGLTAADLQIKLLADNEAIEARARLDSIRQLLVGEQRRIREFMRRTPTRPEKETEVPISLSLRDVLSEVAKQWNCATPVSVEPAQATASPTLIVHLSLMLAEAVANAVRHGRASTVRISMTKAPERMTIRIRDNGHGFKGGATFNMSDEQLRQAGSGPISLHERIRELGGVLSVDSSPTGVELTVELPLTSGL
jgi:signal transduction histidine kinase